MRYPHSPSVKYALTLGLITGLRSSNVRYLNISQLNIDELRLFFPAKGNKIHRDEYLGIPNELASWLLKIKPINSDIFFPSIRSEALSEATLSKALRNFIPIDAKEGLVFHSFRKILSTFCYENRHISKLTPYDIEKALFHKSFGIVEVYNKAMNIQATREVISWWLGYLKDNGLSLE